MFFCEKKSNLIKNASVRHIPSNKNIKNNDKVIRRAALLEVKNSNLIRNASVRHIPAAPARPIINAKEKRDTEETNWQIFPASLSFSSIKKLSKTVFKAIRAKRKRWIWFSQVFKVLMVRKILFNEEMYSNAVKYQHGFFRKLLHNILQFLVGNFASLIVDTPLLSL